MSVLRFSQVLAACVYPPLINSSNLPLDVRQRAQEELGRCVGGSVGEGNVCGLMMWGEKENAVSAVTVWWQKYQKTKTSKTGQMASKLSTDADLQNFNW